MSEVKNQTNITILLPAYNEELNIASIIKSIKKLHPDFEILVIDDGSSDNTLRNAIEAGASVWPHPYNIGIGAAIKTGLRMASGDWVILMSADGQHKTEDIVLLLEEKDKYDMVVGARTLESMSHLHRKLANKVYNWFASYVTKFKVEDLTSGFRIVNKNSISQFINLLPNTFSYPSTITMAYLRTGRSIKYVPIQTKHGEKPSKFKPLRDWGRFFLILMKVATLFSPLRVFLPISVSLFCLATGYYLYTFITLGTFTNMSALLFNSSLIIFMMGLISEQISQMHYDRTR